MKYDKDVYRRRNRARQGRQRAKFLNCYPGVGSSIIRAVNNGNFAGAWAARRKAWHACYLMAGGRAGGMAVLDALGFDGNTDLTRLQEFLNRMKSERDFSIRIGELRRLVAGQ